MVPSQPQTEHSAGESPDGSGSGDQLGRLRVLRGRLQARCYGINDFVPQQP
jgi:hypothetical protein